MDFNALLNTACNAIYFILHVVSMGSFPKPLTAKEEKHYLELAEQGDEAAKNYLVEHNLRLVAHIVKKYYSSGADTDDLISIGTIGLIKAISTFKSDKNIRLATYAARCIENEILMYFRSQKKSAQDISLNEPIDMDKDGNELTIIDIVAVEDTIIDDVDLKMKTERLYRYINEILNEREKEIVILRYGLGNIKPLTQREVAKRLNISRSYVSRIEKHALSQLCKKFEMEDKINKRYGLRIK